MRYLEHQYQKRNSKPAIGLTRAAVGYDWFSSMWRQWPICITDKCIEFERPEAFKSDDDGPSKTATAIWYFGPDFELFERKFGQFGRVLPPEVG